MAEIKSRLVPDCRMTDGELMKIGGAFVGRDVIALVYETTVDGIRYFVAGVGGYIDPDDPELMMTTPIGNGTLGALIRHADSQAPDGKADLHVFEFKDVTKPSITYMRRRFFNRLNLAKPKPGSALVILGDMADTLDGVVPKALNLDGVAPVVHEAHPTRQ